MCPSIKHVYWEKLSSCWSIYQAFLCQSIRLKSLFDPLPLSIYIIMHFYPSLPTLSLHSPPPPPPFVLAAVGLSPPYLYVTIYLYLCTALSPPCLFVCLSVCLSLSISLSLRLSLSLTHSLSLARSLALSISLSLCIYMYLSLSTIYLSPHCLSVCLPLSPSVSLSLFLSISL